MSTKSPQERLILSWDIGTANLACSLIRARGTEIQELIFCLVGDLGSKKSDDWKRIFTRVRKYLDTLIESHPILSQITNVLIETQAAIVKRPGQPGKVNRKMKAVEQMLYAYFTLKFDVRIDFVVSMAKFERIHPKCGHGDLKGGANYETRKKISIWLAGACLTGVTGADLYLGAEGKKDDLADTVCQVAAYIGKMLPEDLRPTVPALEKYFL